MDVGLDQTVPIADPNGHHGVDCDPMSRQVAGIRECKKQKNKNGHIGTP